MNSLGVISVDIKLQNPKNMQIQMMNSERERLAHLKSYSILDTIPETDYNNLTIIASQICQTKISLISLVDTNRQWFKARFGMDVFETPRDISFCTHAIQQPNELFIVPDARKDDRFKNNDLVTGDSNIVFYAGVPIVDGEGYALGTICVMDSEPKQLSEDQKKSLKALSKQVMNLLELRRKKKQLEESLNTQEKLISDLEKFAFIAAHDIKSPLKNTDALANLLAMQYKEKLGSDGMELVENIQLSTQKLQHMVDDLLEYYRSNDSKQEEKTIVSVQSIKEDLQALYSFKESCEISLESSIDEVYANKTTLEQVLINLVGNAIKYNDKDIVKITLGVSDNQDFYNFYVRDNGPGISQEVQEKMFDIFETGTQEDRFGERGSGIGLATVKGTVEKEGGTILVESYRDRGTTFHFTLSK